MISSHFQNIVISQGRIISVNWLLCFRFFVADQKQFCCNKSIKYEQDKTALYLSMCVHSTKNKCLQDFKFQYFGFSELRNFLKSTLHSLSHGSSLLLSRMDKQWLHINQLIHLFSSVLPKLSVFFCLCVFFLGGGVNNSI